MITITRATTRNEIQNVIELQNRLLDLREEDFESFLDFIQSSIYVQSERYFRQLIMTIDALATKNRLPLHLAFQILRNLKDILLKFIEKNELVNSFEQSQFILFFYEEGFVDFTTICNELCGEENYFFFFFPEIRKESFFYYSLFKTYPEIVPKINSTDIEKHKELRRLGCNEHEIALPIQRDDLVQFQEVISKMNISINMRLPFSFYERFLFVNSDDSLPSLIEYSAFFGSINIFKFLWISGAYVDDDLVQYAIAGGNNEIIQYCEEKQLEFDKECLKVAIKFLRNEIAEYIHMNYGIEYKRSHIIEAISSHNYEMLLNLTSPEDNFINGRKSLLINFNDNSINKKINVSLPFVFAANRGYLEIAEYLYAYYPKLKIDAEDGEQVSAIHYAVLNDRLDIVKFIIEGMIKKEGQGSSDRNKDDNENESDNEEEEEPNENENEQNEEVIENGDTLFYYGDDDVFYANEQIMKRNDIHRCFYHAARQGRSRIVKFFASFKNFDANKPQSNGFTALHLAAFNDNVEVIEALADVNSQFIAQELERAFSPDSKKSKRTSPNSKRRNRDIADNTANYLQQKIDFNKIDNKFHYTPLHVAVTKKFIRAVRAILIAGGHLSSENENDENSGSSSDLTPTSSGFKLSLTYVDVNARAKDSFTSLHLAVEADDLEIVKLLVTVKEVDVNAQGGNKKLTPLHIAVKNRRLDIIRFLATNERVNIEAVNKKGESPLFYAVRKQFKDIVQIFDDAIEFRKKNL